jgi:hypothetical protein
MLGQATTEESGRASRFRVSVAGSWLLLPCGNSDHFFCTRQTPATSNTTLPNHNNLCQFDKDTTRLFFGLIRTRQYVRPMVAIEHRSCTVTPVAKLADV